jgi:hypothetical protein
MSRILLAAVFVCACGGSQGAASIAGTATFTDATAHAGIQVAVRGTDHVAVTDGTGAFLLEGVAPGSYSIEASALGYVTAAASVQVSAGQRAQVNLALSRATAGSASVTGTIALQGGGDASGTTVFLDGSTAIAFTAADGSFAFDSVAPGKYTLEARRPGYLAVTTAVTIAAPTTKVDPITLAPEAAANGAIAGVATRGGASSGNAGISVALLGTSWSASTADDGSFRIDGIAPGTYSARVSIAGLAPAVVANVDVTAGQTTALEAIDLEPPADSATLRGRVTRGGLATGNGGISVYLEGATLLAVSDDSGAFQLSGVAPGTYTLAASTPGYALAEAHGVAVAAGQTTQVAEIDLAPGGVGGGDAVGAVAGFAGPIGATDSSGVSVTLSGGNGFSVTSLTDPTGAYSFTNVPVGWYALSYGMADYSPANLTGIPVLPGVYQAPPVALYPGTPVSSGTLTYPGPVSLTPNDLLLTFVSGTSLYHWSTGALQSVTPFSVGVLGLTSDQSGALVSVGNTLAKMAIATGTLTTLSNYTNLYYSSYSPMTFGGRTLFTDGLGQLRFIRPDDNAPSAPIQLGCVPTYAPGVQALSTSVAGAASDWVRFSSYTCPPYPTNSSVLVDLATGQAMPPGDLLSVTDDGNTALLYTSDLGNGRDLVSVDLTTGARTTLHHKVVLFSGTQNYVPIWSEPDANNLGTLSRVDLHTAAVADLVSATALPNFYSAATVAMVSAGSPAQYTVVRFDTGTAVALCPTTNSSVVSQSNYGSTPTLPTFACATGTGPATIVSYDAGTGLRQTVTTNAVYPYLQFYGPHTFSWTENSVMHIARSDVANSATALCSTMTGSLAVSTDESTAAAACGTTYVSYDLAHGTSANAYTFPANAATLGSPSLSPTGRALLASYTVTSTPGAVACGQSGCTLLVDLAYGTSAILPNSAYYYYYGTPFTSTAPGDSGVYFQLGNSMIVAHLAADGIHSTTVTSATYFLPSLSAWGHSGRCALLANGAIIDADQGTSSTIPTVTPTQIGATDAWLAGDNAVDLAGCTSQPLGTAITVLGRSPTGLVYRDGASTELRSFTAAGGVTTIASGTVLLNFYSYYQPARTFVVASGGGSQGTLYDVTPDGVVHQLLQSAAPQVAQLSSTAALAWANPDSTTGDLYLLDLNAERATSLQARTPIRQSIVMSFAQFGSQIVFDGVPPGGTQAFLSVNSDGSGLRVLGPPATPLGAIGGRIVAQGWLDSVTRVQSADGASWLGLDLSCSIVAASPGASAVLVVGSTSHPGLWRVQLP